MSEKQTERMMRLLEEQSMGLLKVFQHVERLDREVAELRARMGISIRARCPKCKAPVHRAARACKACGADWGEEPEPKPIPRERR